MGQSKNTTETDQTHPRITGVDQDCIPSPEAGSLAYTLTVRGENFSRETEFEVGWFDDCDNWNCANGLEIEVTKYNFSEEIECTLTVTVQPGDSHLGLKSLRVKNCDTAILRDAFEVSLNCS